MTPSMLLQLSMHTDAPKRVRASVYVLRFLIHHNRLDGIMAMVGIWWGICTLVWPEFWSTWPATKELAYRTGGFPEITSWTVLVSGVGSYVARYYSWHAVRSIFALAAFSTWVMLAVVSWSVEPLFAPGFACYSLFAFAKLMSYVNFVIQVDQRGAGNDRQHT